MDQPHGCVPTAWRERHGASAIVEGAGARLDQIMDKGRKLEQHSAGRFVASKGQRHGSTVDRDKEPERMPVEARKICDRDCLACAHPGIRDPPSDDERAVGSLHHEGVEEHLVRICNAPGMWRGTLAGTRMASDPG